MTNGIKYIGSKKKLTGHIVELVNQCNNVKSAIDVFTGTTRVAQALKSNGLYITTSDLSWASEAYSHTFIANKDNRHLQDYINELNNLEGYADWITNNYCDITTPDKIVRVWQKKNGMKADAIRNKIEEYDLEKWEKMTLITALIFALDKVDNTVGIQQSYLKDWCKRSFKDLKLELPHYTSGQTGNHITGNCLTVEYEPADLAYLDPPYSAHSYATYYHIWDSIVRWDKPEVGLKTNRRVDRISGDDSYDKSMISEWNTKSGAKIAFDSLLSRLPVRYMIISYNNESLLSYDELISICEKHGRVKVELIDYKRNIMCQIGNATRNKSTGYNTRNTEYLILIEK